MTNYRADIDGLRAVAVLGVVLFHAVPQALPGGFVGVDIFFVISGYLITNLLRNALARGQFSIAGFYVRRMRRIFPALIVVLLACLLFGWFALLADEYRQLTKHTVAGAAFVANFVLWNESGYFDNSAETKPLLHLWSLAVEEQFYLVWPVLFWLQAKAAGGRSHGVLLLAGLSFAYSCTLSFNNATAAFYSPLSRFWELSLGGLVAYYGQPSREDRVQDHQRSDALSLAGLLLIACAFLLVDRDQPFPGLLALIPAVGTVLILMAGPKAAVNRWVLARPAMVGIGVISYPLYLWHWPALSFVRIIEGRTPTLPVTSMAVMLSLAFAWLTYCYVEAPIRKRRPDWNLAFGLAVCLLSVSLLAAVAFAYGGVPGRSEDFEQRSARLRADNVVVETDPACLQTVGLGVLRYCRLHDSSRPPTVALFGDSHANRLFEPLAELFALRGHNLLLLGAAGCVPYWDIETGRGAQANGCPDQIHPQLSLIVNASAIRSVILLHRGPLHLTGIDPVTPVGSAGHYFLRDGSAPSSSAEVALGEGMSRTLRRLRESGKHITFLLDWPELTFDPRACLSRPLNSLSPQSGRCRVSRDWVDARNRDYRSLVAAVAARQPRLHVVDLQVPLCDARWCHASLDGVVMYRDADHLNRTGAMFVVDALRDELLSAIDGQ
jgi:peptidoglycan/LPS O-acetylase OafA/YrhL